MRQTRSVTLKLTLFAQRLAEYCNTCVDSCSHLTFSNIAKHKVPTKHPSTMHPLRDVTRWFSGECMTLAKKVPPSFKRT